MINDEIAWPGLINCVCGSLEEFDANWQALQDEMNENGLEQLEEDMTAWLAEKINE